MIAAIATDQLTARQGYQHKLVIIQIAANASGEKRSPWLAVVYDELIRFSDFLHVIRIVFYVCLRKEWADKSAKLREKFDIGTAVMTVDSKIRDDARALYDQLVAKSRQNEWSGASGSGKTGGKGSQKGFVPSLCCFCSCHSSLCQAERVTKHTSARVAAIPVRVTLKVRSVLQIHPPLIYNVKKSDVMLAMAGATLLQNAQTILGTDHQGHQMLLVQRKLTPLD